ncbi:MAG: hypothetical protein ACXVAN_07505 [Polyangia bacterium]
MYRQTSLRLPCVACGVEQPLARMELSPRGGHWCWRCQVGAQIVEHEGPRRRRHTRPPSTLRQLRGTFLAVGAIAGGIGLICLLFLALLAAYGRSC